MLTEVLVCLPYHVRHLNQYFQVSARLAHEMYFSCQCCPGRPNTVQIFRMLHVGGTASCVLHTSPSLAV